LVYPFNPFHPLTVLPLLYPLNPFHPLTVLFLLYPLHPLTAANKKAGDFRPLPSHQSV
jgi:hypothetical protein